MINFTSWVFCHNSKKWMSHVHLKLHIFKTLFGACPSHLCEWHIHFFSCSSQKPKNYPGNHLLILHIHLHIHLHKNLQVLHSWHWECTVSWTHLLLWCYCHLLSPNHYCFLLGQLQVFSPNSLFLLSSSHPTCMFRPWHDFRCIRIKVNLFAKCKLFTICGLPTLISSHLTRFMFRFF